MPSAGHADQVKTYQEIERNRFKRSTCLIRTVNCSCSIKSILIIIIIIIIIITMLTGRFATTFTANWQNCYRKFGSFATLADLLPWLADLLPGLADLLPGLADLLPSDFHWQICYRMKSITWLRSCLRIFDAPFVKAEKCTQATW